MDTPTGDKARTIAGNRTPLSRRVAVLLFATAALFMFIVAQGDARRRATGLKQMTRYAETLTARLAGTSQIPLNLAPDTPSADNVAGSSQTMSYHIEWLSSNDVRNLRGLQGRAIVAWTVSLGRTFGGDGRAVVIFENGSFSVEWMSTAQFEEAIKAQSLAVSRIANPGD